MSPDDGAFGERRVSFDFFAHPTEQSSRAIPCSGRGQEEEEEEEEETNKDYNQHGTGT